MATVDGGFVWYQLVTSDVGAAGEFYSRVAGWNVVDAGRSGMEYALARVGERQVGGLTSFSPQAGGGASAWTGYVLVSDVDAMVERLIGAGGAARGPAVDMPGIGRFAMVADPQGAVFALFQGSGEAAPELAATTPGAVGWHELHTSDWEAAFAFYEELFGWERSFANDMGPMGVYQTFSIAGEWVGGMMNDIREAPAWLFYVTVEDIDAAAARVAEAGGVVMHGPLQVPGGNWVLMGTDPQGANFALSGARAA